MLSGEIRWWEHRKSCLRVAYKPSTECDPIMRRNYQCLVAAAVSGVCLPLLAAVCIQSEHHPCSSTRTAAEYSSSIISSSTGT